jgi:hypothetical protein
LGIHGKKENHITMEKMDFDPSKIYFEDVKLIAIENLRKSMVNLIY